MTFECDLTAFERHSLTCDARGALALNHDDGHLVSTTFARNRRILVLSPDIFLSGAGIYALSQVTFASCTKILARILDLSMWR